MLSTAMKAPSVAPITAIQVFAEIAGVALPGVTAALGAPVSSGTALRAGWNVVMVVSSCSAEAGCIRRLVSIITESMEGLSGSDWIMCERTDALIRRLVGGADVGSEPGPGFAVGQHGRLGVDGRLGRHARAQQAGELVVVEHDLHRHALHDLGEIAGGVVGRQQREFET